MTRTCTRSRGRTSTTAKKWAAKAGVKSGTTVEYYTSNTGSAPLVAQIVQFNLKQIGLNVNSHLFARAVQIDKEGTRGEPFDITSEGWIADYADPYDFINVLLSGDSLHASNNNNVAYFNDPTYNKQMRSAALLSGQPRYTAYGNLDVSMMEKNPPWAARNNFNDRILLSKPRGLLHLQRDLQRRPRGALPEVDGVETGAERRRRGAWGAPPPSSFSVPSGSSRARAARRRCAAAARRVPSREHAVDVDLRAADHEVGVHRRDVDAVARARLRPPRSTRCRRRRGRSRSRRRACRRRSRPVSPILDVPSTSATSPRNGARLVGRQLTADHVLALVGLHVDDAARPRSAPRGRARCGRRARAAASSGRDPRCGASRAS